MIVRIHCFAKLNLYLRVLSRTTDGYHNIETLFQSIALHDVLDLIPRKTVTELVTIEGTSPPARKNIIIKAVKELIREKGGTPPSGVLIRLRKRIPKGAGLGGGSSDAAGVIRGLSLLWDLELKEEEQERIAMKTGADVHYFFTGGTAVGTSRGEKVEPLNVLPPYHVLIVKLPFEVPTREIYDKSDSLLTDMKKIISIKEVFSSLSAYKKAAFYNELEKVARKDYPIIGEIRKALENTGPRVAGMTGSGPTVFALYKSRKQADEALCRVRFPGTEATITRTINRGEYETGINILETD